MARTYVVDWIGGQCPVQAEGHLGGKTKFYFRARGKRWQIWIGRKPLPSPDDCWHYEEPFGETDFDAGFMGEEIALKFIDRAIKRYYKETK